MNIFAASPHHHGIAAARRSSGFAGELKKFSKLLVVSKFDCINLDESNDQIMTAFVVIDFVCGGAPKARLHI